MARQRRPECARDGGDCRLKEADADSLDVSDYHIPNFTGLGPDALAEADLKLTQTVLTFARHLQAGRFPYKRVSQSNIQLPQAPPDPAAVLDKVVDATDAGKALDEFSPPHEAYQKLKVKLAEMRAKSAGARSEVADGPVLKHNVKDPMQDPRVPLLREKFGLPGDKSDLAYDGELAAAVRRFQQASELPATGNLDARTVKELNRPIRDKQINLVIANMERWRWYPRDLGSANVIVNQPDFTLKVMHNGSQIWTTRVVIGAPSPSKQTPLLSETMKSVTVNPMWNVPPSIMYNEYMPALARDPTVLARMGLNVSYGPDGSVSVVLVLIEQHAVARSDVPVLKIAVSPARIRWDWHVMPHEPHFGVIALWRKPSNVFLARRLADAAEYNKGVTVVPGLARTKFDVVLPVSARGGLSAGHRKAKRCCDN